MGDERARPLFLVVTIKPRPDRREQARERLESMRAASEAEPGCVFMHLTQPQDDPDMWVMLEMFASCAAWDEHMTRDHVTQGNAALEEMLREPSDLRLLDRARPPRRRAGPGQDGFAARHLAPYGDLTQRRG